MAGRRGKGEGSIFQRADGTWCSIIETGCTADGKRTRKTIYGKTKKEVTDKLTRFQNQKLDGTLIPDDHTTTEEFIDWWLENSAATRVRESTLHSYRQVCRVHIKPKIGAVKLQKLAPAHVQGLVASMLRDGKSARLTQMTYTILHRALVVAVKQGMVVRNVADAIDRPNAPKHEIKPMSGEQVAKLLEAAESDRLFALYVIALATGCRQGELFGLEWDDIDLKAGTLQVRRTLVELSGKLSTNEPKTAKGRRMIPLPAMAVDASFYSLDREKK